MSNNLNNISSETSLILENVGEEIIKINNISYKKGNIPETSQIISLYGSVEFYKNLKN